MSCLPCSTAPVCDCTASQSCSLTVRTCTVCSIAFCQDRITTPSAPSTLGTTIGSALGGIFGILIILGCVYWFWWKDRGLAASRQRYSRHLSRRESKLSVEKRGSTQKPEDGIIRKRSVHLKVEGGEESLAHRNTGVSPYLIDDSGRDSETGATGTRTNESVDSLMDNPFADHARHSISATSTRTSDFSFRSSQSTNIIPIAYIPPHSASLSLDDTHRGAFGEPEGSYRDSYSTRRNNPPSLLSLDSIVEIGILEPMASPDSKNHQRSSTHGAPVRPPRLPGLDLQLPTTTPPLLSPPNSAGLNHQRTGSGFPWSSQQPSNRLVSTFSNSSRDTRDSQNERRRSNLSYMSTTSVGTSRSGGSTMSYILDPPQIITPVDARGLRRVEVLGRERGGLVRLNGNGVVTPPTQIVSNPFADHQTPRARTETEESYQTNQSRWTATTQGTEDGRESLSSAFTNTRNSTTSTGEGSGDSGATGERTRSLMSTGKKTDDLRRSISRNSVASNTTIDQDSQSMLNGIEFSVPSSASADSLNLVGSSTGSFPSFPLPPSSSQPLSPGIIGSTIRERELSTEDSPLPAPFMPFAANQRPTSTNTVDTTRYGSGLSGLDGIPFQLGFNGLNGGASERGSTFTVNSFISDDGSFVTAGQGTGSLLSRPSVEPLRITKREGEELEDDPFGKNAEVDRSSTLLEASTRAMIFLDGEE